MAFKNFNISLVFRLLWVTFSALLLGVAIAKNQWVVISMAAISLIISFVLMIHFLNKTNRKISFFIQAIKNDDTTLRFPMNKGNSIINELHQSLNELNEILQQTKIKSQIRERYFSEILQNIGTGVIVYNSNGFVSDVNRAALDLFEIQTLTHLAQFDRIDLGLKKQLNNLQSGQKQMITIKRKNTDIQLISRCSTIQLKDEQVKLLTLQDIRGELERKEIDSWVKLIRVLSHEIMNSLTPVTSISQSLICMWKEAKDTKNQSACDLLESSINGLEVIGERSEALIRFVQSYRMLTQVPKLNIESIKIYDLFDRLSILISPFKDEYQSKVEFVYPENDFEIHVDEQMLIQVIINLVKNALEALIVQNDGVVKVEVSTGLTTSLVVCDNGPGIDAEVKDSIFIPFFTTKEKGTGVGLSYSRQIIKAHGGTILCKSEPGETCFELVL